MTRLPKDKLLSGGGLSVPGRWWVLAVHMYTHIQVWGTRLENMYMYMYIYIYVHAHIYTCVCVYIYIHMHLYIYIHIYNVLFLKNTPGALDLGMNPWSFQRSSTQLTPGPLQDGSHQGGDLTEFGQLHKSTPQPWPCRRRAD